MKQISRREFLRLTAVTLGTGALAACVAPTAPPPAAPAEEAKPAAAPAAEVGIEGKKGILWGLQYDPHVEAYNRLAKLFNTKTGATMEVQPQQWPVDAKLAAALAAGTGPDVMCFISIATTAAQGIWMDCTDIVYKANGTDVSKDYYGDAIASFSLGGKIWGVPTEMGGIGNVVNMPTDDMKRAGVDLNQYAPWNGKCGLDSYEQMWDLAKKLQIEEDGKVKKWGLSSQGWDAEHMRSLVEEVSRHMGTHWWDPKTEKFNFDSEAGIIACQTLVEKPVALGIETQLDVSHVDAAMSGRVCIAVGNGTPAVLGWQQGYDYNICTDPPVYPGERYVCLSSGGWGFVAPKKAKNPDLSIAFLRMLDSLDAHKTWEQIYGGKRGPYKALQGVFDHFEGLGKDPNKEGKAVVIAQWVDKCHVWENNEYYGEDIAFDGDILAALVDPLAQVRQQKMTSAEAVKIMQANLEQARQKYLDTMSQLKA